MVRFQKPAEFPLNPYTHPSVHPLCELIWQLPPASYQGTRQEARKVVQITVSFKQGMGPGANPTPSPSLGFPIYKTTIL